MFWSVSAALIASLRTMGTMCARINCRVPANFPKRLKIAAAEEEMTQGELLEYLLDQRERKIKERFRSQAHPLHIPRENHG